MRWLLLIDCILFLVGLGAIGKHLEGLAPGSGVGLGWDFGGSGLQVESRRASCWPVMSWVVAL